MGTIEECGGNGGESLAGVEVDDGTDVTVDAEDLLDDDDSGRAGVLGGASCAEIMPRDDGRLRRRVGRGNLLGEGILH